MKKICLIVILVLCVAFASQIAFCQSVGVIDIDRILSSDAIPLIKSVIDDIKIQEDTMIKELGIRETNKLLTNEEIKELVSLPANDKRAIELIEANKSKETELADLRQVKTYDDAQRERLYVLTELQKKSEDAFIAVRSEYEKGLNDLLAEKENQIIEKIIEMSGTVAKEKSLQLVVIKRVVIWSADNVDITDAVIEKLPEKL